MKRKRKVNLNVNIDVDQDKALREWSDVTGIPKAMLVRRGVDMAIAELEERRRAETMGFEIMAKEERDALATED